MFGILRSPSTTSSTLGEVSFLLCRFIDRRLGEVSFLLCRFIDRRLFANINCVYVPMCVEERNPWNLGERIESVVVVV